VSIAVLQIPVKKSRASIVRRPFAETTSMLASSARATAGYSAAGSACAIDPPSVPRLRIWKCPISGVATASSGTADATSALASTVACAVQAPIHSAPPRRSMPESSGIRPMSTRCSNTARRSASSGIRL